MPPKNAGGRKKAANGYQMPAPVPLGTLLTDMAKRQWKVGPSIGSGGFGEIYCACEASSGTKRTDDYPYVVKIEPHGNGPLFVEMHFYMRNAKQDEIEKFRKARGLKHLGMPHFVGNGSHELQNLKHRFLVMPRYSMDLWGIFLKNEKRFPQHTVYRIALQMVDVLEYIHECSYVHADLKAANILLGFGKTASKQQLYLVDFGLASHYTNKDFKPDPKKMHNGTIEYTSRDAHQGVPTMRGDMEVLAYNLVHWSGATLPWEAEKLLTTPVKVQDSKEKHMKDVGGFMKYCFKKDIPKPIQDYAKYVAGLKFNDKPDYQKCRKMFESGLKELGKPNSGDLEFEPKKAGETSKKRAVEPDSTESSGPMAKPRNRAPKVIQTSPDTTSQEPAARQKPTTPARSSQRRPRVETPDLSEPALNGTKTSTPSSEVVSSKLPSMQEAGSIRLGKSASVNAKIKTTYAFNFELDVSIDADVIVNVRRKKKAPQAAPEPADSPVPESPVAPINTTPRRVTNSLLNPVARNRKSPSPPAPVQPTRSRARKPPPHSFTPVAPKRARRNNTANMTTQSNTHSADTTAGSENISVISLNTTEGSVQPDDDTVPNSDPNTPEPRYLASRSVRQAGRSNGTKPVRAGEYKGKKARA
ncbi:nucleosomal histone kinase 1 [Culex quinquefasciatus]|uniref:nucleosomal histone kinase 1 n=1 Tax=Culex quinquefasciatus TaxID=7176 RepID=UPI0018E2E8FE|nr:nucleosomal histone kinase 1 [Culex quinquefasciatus]XP_038104549.1 nucleosomal histone kinase 1 [Culex quinquefasciatus]